MYTPNGEWARQQEDPAYLLHEGRARARHDLAAELVALLTITLADLDLDQLVRVERTID